MNHSIHHSLSDSQVIYQVYCLKKLFELTGSSKSNRGTITRITSSSVKLGRLWNKVTHSKRPSKQLKILTCTNTSKWLRAIHIAIIHKNSQLKALNNAKPINFHTLWWNSIILGTTRIHSKFLQHMTIQGPELRTPSFNGLLQVRGPQSASHVQYNWTPLREKEVQGGSGTHFEITLKVAENMGSQLPVHSRKIFPLF